MSASHGTSVPTFREKNPAPFTIAHFKAWASELVLDTGENWILEPFQAAFLKDLFSGYLESWLIIPEGNAKTTLAGALCLYHAQFRPNASVPIAASSRDQAQWLYLAAAGFVDRSPSIEKLFRCQEGYRRIRYDKGGSRIQIFAADDRTGDGVIPTLCILEELHRHRDLGLYRTWRGKLEKRGAQLVAISTAGEPDGEFEQTRDRMRKEATSVTRRGAFLRATSETTVIHEYSVPEEWDTENFYHVKKANPLKTITIDVLKRKRASPAMVPAHWRRFVCGTPARMEAWIEPQVWDGLAVDIGGIQEGDVVWIGLVCNRRGPSAIALATQKGENIAAKVIIGEMADTELEQRLRDLTNAYPVMEITYALTEFHRSAEILELEGLPMVETPHSPQRMMISAVTLNRLIVEGLLRHDGDPELRKHVLRAATVQNRNGWTFDKTPETAGLVALAMACERASQNLGEPQIAVF